MRKKIKQGVSPVIGVVLMVAVTVALVALVTVVVFDIGDDVSEPADITIDTSTDSNGTGLNATVEVIRNENVESLKVSGGPTSVDKDVVVGSEGEVGSETVNVVDSSGETASEGDTFDVIATVGENEEVVGTIEAPEDISGT